ncbi:iron transporter [Saliphagus sp. LR7]|uniref:iron transporter n=1 Tax=Saliphagus sp. LR7 TaxID=2282654 RepID=UPI000DF74001|nr:iron transporter [Saliphagus sp. LR7]
MNRRAVLRRVGTAGGLALAGCLEGLGFEEESAWRDPPLVSDRPDAVYVPASTETMGTYGRAVGEEYAVSLSYTVPHRFWTVAGRETSRVTVGTDDTIHLMCTVWAPGTDHVLPVEVGGDLRRDGESVRSFSPWPMLSQRMGFHYGDNVALPDEGAYTLELSVGPTTARPVGEFEGRFERQETFELGFEYERSQIHEVEFEEVPEDRRGERGALELMDYSGMDGEGGNGDHDGENGSHAASDGGTSDDPGHPPTSRGVPIEELPGTILGSARTGDAELSVVKTDPVYDAESYLAVFARTPHNDVVLPFMSLSARIGGEEAALTETLAPELGPHHGVETDALEAGTEITVAVEAIPQVARHDGYETAFFEFEDVTVTVGE